MKNKYNKIVSTLSWMEVEVSQSDMLRLSDLLGRCRGA